MGRTRLRRISYAAASDRGGNLYPLQGQFFAYGIMAGIAGAALFGSLLAGLACFTVLLVAGLLWRRGEAPVLAYCLVFQWMFIAPAYLFMLVTGRFPGLSLVGDVETAVFLSLVGLVALALGIRGGMGIWKVIFGGRFHVSQLPETRYNLRKLFFTFLVLYTVDWVVARTPMQVWFQGAQIISKTLVFRRVLLAMLVLEALRQRRGYRYVVAAYMVIWLPSLISYSSSITGPYTLILLAILTEWRPWSDVPAVRARSAKLMKIAVVIAGLVLFLRLFWVGALKGDWRAAYLQGRVQGDPVERISTYLQYARENVDEFELGNAVEQAGSRVSSSLGYFSLVLERVPRVVPFENGRLTWRAIGHVTRPRVLFPEKPNLGGDSWMVRKYAGLEVAGAEQSTSVGLTYMGEFYVDFGYLWMFVPLMSYGIIVGFLYIVLMQVSVSRMVFNGMIIVVFSTNFNSYGGEIAKLLGGLIMNVLIFALIVFVFGSKLERFLGK